MIKNTLRINISLILILSGSFIALDLVKLLVTPSLSPIPSLVLKGLIVFMTSLLVFLINKDGLNEKDTKLLKLIFFLIIFADLSLILFKEPYVGISIFFFVQCVLIYRNSRCIPSRYSVVEIFNKYNIILILILLASLLVYLLLARNYMEDEILFVCFLLYGIIKSGSVFAAILNYRFKAFPKINRKLLLVGVICFYLCDICVGFTLIFGNNTIGSLASIFTWIFYTPALTLIALSGYDFKLFTNFTRF